MSRSQVAIWYPFGVLGDANPLRDSSYDQARCRWPRNPARASSRTTSLPRSKALAALNNPNIAQMHGLEKSEGTRALVMEPVEGPRLADRIAQGAIPVEEALPLAKQI